MLVALMEKERILAGLAEKGRAYFCPGCSQEVTVKKGRKIIHHFAHKPPVSCSWAAGETQLHLKAKELLYLHFKAEGRFVEIEYPIADRQLRADVLVSARNGQSVAFELQHSTISPDEIEHRTSLYFQHRVALTWLPLIRLEKLEFERTMSGGIVKRYSPKPFERWIHGFNFGHIWYFDPESAQLWHGKFDKCMIDVPYNEWYESGGHHVSVGGYEKISKRWKKLTLTGPFFLNDVTFTIKPRPEAKIGAHWYPKGAILAIESKMKEDVVAG